MSLFMAAYASTPLLSQHLIEENAYVSVSLPKEPLANKSLMIAPLEVKPYVDWTDEEHSSVYHSLQKTVGIWKDHHIADQYMIYGKQESGDKGFSWEAVPYNKPSNILGRFWQQFLVLWRITFGGITTTEEQKQEQLEEYNVLFEEFSPSISESAEKINNTVPGNDAFCKQDVIDKQLVLAGRKIHVLFNYAPIGFGGEKLHFLIVPKEHKDKFSDLSEEEYLEASEVTQKLIRHFKGNRPIEDIYLFHKTGVDAGQTVPHWHQHMILTTSKTQDVFGKFTVLKNMLIGSSPMKGAELANRVQSLKSELKYLEDTE